VAVLVRGSWAVATTAPEASATVPLMVASSWARRVGGRATRATREAKDASKLLKSADDAGKTGMGRKGVIIINSSVSKRFLSEPYLFLGRKFGRADERRDSGRENNYSSRRNVVKMDMPAQAADYREPFSEPGYRQGNTGVALQRAVRLRRRPALRGPYRSDRRQDF